MAAVATHHNCSSKNSWGQDILKIKISRKSRFPFTLERQYSAKAVYYITSKKVGEAPHNLSAVV
jgi:hypothetical protein